MVRYCSQLNTKLSPFYAQLDPIVYDRVRNVSSTLITPRILASYNERFISDIVHRESRIGTTSHGNYEVLRITTNTRQEAKRAYL